METSYLTLAAPSAKPKEHETMKYRHSMTQAELDQFMREQQALEDAYTSSAEHDAKVQVENPAPDEYEDPSDYIGMGWIDSRGRP